MKTFLISFNWFLLFITISLSKIDLSKNDNLFLLFNDEEITIKIKGSGDQYVLYKTFSSSLSTIYIGSSTVSQTSQNQIKLNTGENDISEIKLVFSNKLTDCSFMFQNLVNIVYIDLSGFDTSQVVKMNYMFYGCHSLTSIVLGTFDTKKVENMGSIFYECNSLKEIDVSGFDTSSVTNMASMFSDCFLLTSIDVSHFITDKVESMASMFNNCSNLVSLDLSSFKTSNVEQFTSMFAHCKTISSLNLSNFITNKATLMERMFSNCVNLEYINLDKATQKSSLSAFDSFDDIFNNIPLNAVICINTFPKITEQLSSLTYHSIDCSDNWRQSQKKKRVILNNDYVDECGGTSKYEFENKCYQICPEPTNDNNNDFLCEKDVEVQIITTLLNYNKKEPTTYIETPLAPITEKIERQVTDNLEGLVTEKIERPVTNNLERIVTDIIVKQEKTNKIQNTDKVDVEQTDKEEKNIKTNKVEKNENIVETYISKNTFIKETKKAICETRDFLLNNCKVNSIQEQMEVNQNIIQSILDGSLTDILKNIIETKEEFKKESQNEVIHISTLKENINLNDTYTNDTIVDFGNCSSILREQYGYYDKEIFLLMIEHFFDEIKIPITEYYLFDEEGKTQFNLEYCNENTINKYFSLEINPEDEYKYDPSSDYYNDGCFPNSEENGIDTTLYDRKEIFNNERSLCEKNCTYKEYNYVNKKVNCECRINTEFITLYDVSIDKTKLINTFKNVKKKSNIYVIKCQNLLFNKDNIITNIGSYTMLGIIFISFICSVSFCFRGYGELKFKINVVSFLEPSIIGKKDNSKNTKTQNGKKPQFNQNFIIKNVSANKNRKIKNNNGNKKSTISNPIKHIELNRKKNKNQFGIKNQKSNNRISSKNLSSSHKRFNFPSFNLQTVNKKKNSNTKRNIMAKTKKVQKNEQLNYEISDYEINNFKLEEAIKFDHRTYCEYYISLIKAKHLLIFTFCTSNDYNSKVIKITLFFFTFALFYSTNAMFFTDSTMHEIFESKGKYDIIYQLPQIFYTTLISSGVKLFLSYISLTETNIIETKNTIKLEAKLAKQMKKNKKVDHVFSDAERIEQLMRCIVVKTLLFFVCDFLCLAVFWYYLSSFGAVFENTQIHLLEDTLISFGTSLIYPFFIYLLSGIFRIPALRMKNSCLYKFSKILQLL